MTLPGETEAGSAGMHPCRGIAWWAHRDDVAGRGSSPFALYPKTHRIGRPLCLENPRPEGAEYSLTESELSPLHAEPAHAAHPVDPKSFFWACARIAFILAAAVAWWQEHQTVIGLRLQ